MNTELIERLDDQAFEFAMSTLTPERSFNVVKQEKFAELIIKQCCYICTDNSYLTGDGYRALIHEHFGLTDD